MAIGTPETSRVEAQCQFPINFTTRFHKLHMMRNSKTPVKQPPSLGGTNPPLGPGLLGVLVSDWSILNNDCQFKNLTY